MSFTGHEDHSISLNEAAALTRNYRDSVPPGTVISGYFSHDGLSKILDQSACVGVRIYYALSESGDPKFVLVGAKADGDDLYKGELAEHSVDCPPFCPTPNPLSS